MRRRAVLHALLMPFCPLMGGPPGNTLFPCSLIAIEWPCYLACTQQEGGQVEFAAAEVQKVHGLKARSDEPTGDPQPASFLAASAAAATQHARSNAESTLIAAANEVLNRSSILCPPPPLCSRSLAVCAALGAVGRRCGGTGGAGGGCCPLLGGWKAATLPFYCSIAQHSTAQHSLDLLPLFAVLALCLAPPAATARAARHA
jgi:hypothetical protein